MVGRRSLGPLAGLVRRGKSMALRNGFPDVAQQIANDVLHVVIGQRPAPFDGGHADRHSPRREGGRPRQQSEGVAHTPARATTALQHTETRKGPRGAVSWLRG
jgi:hypothetical protein